MLSLITVYLELFCEICHEQIYCPICNVSCGCICRQRYCYKLEYEDPKYNGCNFIYNDKSSCHCADCHNNACWILQKDTFHEMSWL